MKVHKVREVEPSSGCGVDAIGGAKWLVDYVMEIGVT